MVSVLGANALRAWVRTLLETSLFSFKKALTTTLNPIAGSATKFFVMILKFVHTYFSNQNFWRKKIWHLNFPDTKNIIEEISFEGDFYNSTYNCNHGIFQKKLRTVDHCNSGSWESHKIYSISTWHWLARLCHTQRFDPQKQQILFVSSAQKSI